MTLCIIGVCATFVRSRCRESSEEREQHDNGDNVADDKTYKDLEMDDVSKCKYKELDFEWRGTSQPRQKGDSCIYENAYDDQHVDATTATAQYGNVTSGMNEYYNTSPLARGQVDVAGEQDLYDTPA